MNSFTPGEIVGLLFLMPWCCVMLWFLYCLSRADNQLFTWPFTHPKEFLAWPMVMLLATGILYLMYESSILKGDTATLAHRHKTAPGKYVADKGEHNMIVYSFVAGKVRYTAEGGSDKASAEELANGIPFYVYYDPANPYNNSLSDPEGSYRSIVVNFWIFSVFALGILTGAIRELRRCVPRCLSAI